MNVVVTLEDYSNKPFEKKSKYVVVSNMPFDSDKVKLKILDSDSGHEMEAVVVASELASAAKRCKVGLFE